MEVINDTGWIDKLNPVAKISDENVALKTIEKLNQIFRAIDCKVTKDFGEAKYVSNGNSYTSLAEPVKNSQKQSS